jgi:hypothetical protein
MIDPPLPTTMDEAKLLIGGGALALYAFLTMRQRRKADPKAKLPAVLYIILVLGLITFLGGFVAMVV